MQILVINVITYISNNGDMNVLGMNDLLAPVSKSICQSVPYSNLPTLYPGLDIGNLSSGFILIDLVMSIYINMLCLNLNSHQTL